MVLPHAQVEENSTGKRRRVDDERWLNSFLAYMMFTSMETLNNNVPYVVRRKDKLVSADLEKAYYKVFMHKKWRKFMCFEHKEKFNSSNVLLFGMGPASYWFTKISRPMLDHFL